MLRHTLNTECEHHRATDRLSRRSSALVMHLLEQRRMNFMRILWHSEEALCNGTSPAEGTVGLDL